MCRTDAMVRVRCATTTHPYQLSRSIDGSAHDGASSTRVPTLLVNNSGCGAKYVAALTSFDSVRSERDLVSRNANHSRAQRKETLPRIAVSIASHHLRR